MPVKIMAKLQRETDVANVLSQMCQFVHQSPEIGTAGKEEELSPEIGTAVKETEIGTAVKEEPLQEEHTYAQHLTKSQKKSSSKRKNSKTPETAAEGIH